MGKVREYKYWSFGWVESLKETIIALLVNLSTKQWSMNQSCNCVNGNSKLRLSASGSCYDCCSFSTGRQISNCPTDWLPSVPTDSCSQTVTNTARQTLIMSLKENPFYRERRIPDHISRTWSLVFWRSVCELFPLLRNPRCLIRTASQHFVRVL